MIEVTYTEVYKAYVDVDDSDRAEKMFDIERVRRDRCLEQTRLNSKALDVVPEDIKLGHNLIQNWKEDVPAAWAIEEWEKSYKDDGRGSAVGVIKHIHDNLWYEVDCSWGYSGNHTVKIDLVRQDFVKKRFESGKQKQLKRLNLYEEEGKDPVRLVSDARKFFRGNF